MNEEGDVNDPATLAHIARLSLSDVVEKKRIFDTLSRFAVEQNELLDVVGSLRDGREVLAPFTSVAFIEGKITNCDELLVKLSSSQDQFYAERTREQTCEMLRKRRVFAEEKLLRAEEDLRKSEIEHRETMRVLSEKFESLSNITDGEPKSRVIEGPNGRKTVLTPRDGEIVDVLEIDESVAAADEGEEEREDEVMQMRNEKEIERDREEREKAKGELESWLLKIEEMERLEELQDAEEVEEEKEEEEEEEGEAATIEGEKSTNVASSSSASSHNTTSSSQQRIQIRAGIDSGMPVIERGFEKDGEDRGVRSGDGESGGAEKPMSKFMMRQLGLL
ncbi:unnamed protein product [Bathycoccus prasinos]|jgi:prefoldin subunit 5